jgi:hypothetical protein
MPLVEYSEDINIESVDDEGVKLGGNAIQKSVPELVIVCD